MSAPSFGDGALAKMRAMFEPAATVAGMGRGNGSYEQLISRRRAEGAGQTVPLVAAVEILARELMRAKCPFEGVSGDFDACSASTRELYEQEAAAAFGLSLSGYYALCGDE